MAAKLIILFAKAPLPGRVKTRLVPALSPEMAAELHTAFVHDMIARFRHFDGADFELHTDMCSDAWESLRVTRKLQILGDLGLKMIHAIEQGLAAGARRVLLLGSDAPTLPSKLASDLLDSAADVALGPASDGGFYGISASRTDPAMFHGVTWSRMDTLSRTLDAIQRCGLSVETGAPWFDVDEPQDLQRLFFDGNLPPHTAACITKIRSRRGSG